MPELPDVDDLRRAAARAHRRAGARGGAPGEPLPAAHGRSAAVGGARQAGARRAPARQARSCSASRTTSSSSFHLMIAGRLRWRDARREARRQDRPRGVRLPERHAAAHRGEPEAARVAARRARRGGARGASTAAASSRSSATSARSARRSTRENHTLKRALTDPRALQRHRQRLLGRDPARAPGCRRSTLTQRARRRRDRAPARRDAGDADGAGLDDAARGGRRAFPGEASPRSARAWPCTAATASRARSAARRCSASATPTTRRNYCAALPDRRPAARRPRAVAPAARRLAEEHRGAGGERAGEGRMTAHSIVNPDFHSVVMTRLDRAIHGRSKSAINGSSGQAGRWRKK